MLDPLMLVSVAIQLPLFGGLYAFNNLVRAGLVAGRRFLWIADLGRPDGWIALAAQVERERRLIEERNTASD